MRKSYSLAVPLILACFFPITGQAGQLHYIVDVRNPAEHIVHVTLKLEGFKAKKASFQMPVWAPGAYSVSHYGKYVTGLKAFDKKGNALPVTTVNEDRWEFKDGAKVAEIRYDIRDSHKDTTSLYFAMANMDTSLFFANATALFGYWDDDKKASATVEYQKPPNWQLISALPPSKAGFSKELHPTFQDTKLYASDYDVLVDAPVMAAPKLITRTFQDGAAIYDIAVYTQHSFSDAKADSLALYMQKIVHAETDFFHDTPFERYSFIIYAPDLKHLPSYAQGALEHANASDYLLINLGWSQFKQSFLPIFSHEFFHLWDVKRIHSSKLGPFDYTKRVMTTSLWMAEGVTDYYAHSLLSRYGITKPSAFYNSIKDWVDALAQAKARNESLEDLSIDESDFHMENAMLFYIKGPLVAMMLDLEIRNQTNNDRSLDDVMHALGADARKGKTFTDESLIHKVQEYAGVDLTGFYNQYIHGTDSLPIEKYLAIMGLRKAPEDESAGQTSSMALTSDGRLIFQRIDSTSSIAKSGVKEGDVLISVNGTKISMDNVDLLSSLKDSAASATFKVQRNGEVVEVPVTFEKKKAAKTERMGWLEIDPDATPLQNAIRRGVAGEN